MIQDNVQLLKALRALEVFRASKAAATTRKERNKYQYHIRRVQLMIKEYAEDQTGDLF